MKLPSRFLLLLALVLSVAVRADPVDDYIRAEMEKQHVPGLSLAVLRDGRIVKAEGYGLADVENNIPARVDTVYKIGSISKQFIATGIMLLVQEGKLGVDDPISRHLDGTPPAWKDITVRHFLTHTSGVQREGPAFDSYKVQPDIDVIKSAYAMPLRFATGEQYEYCNTGYFALAEIVARRSGQPWDEFLRQRVFAPLGMNATRTTSVNAIIPHRARGYEWEEERWQNALEYIALRPSGAFVSTVLDLAKWDAALYTEDYLTRSTREQMWTPVRLNSGELYPYGFGWRVERPGGHREIGHSGTLTGFRGQFTRYVDDRLSVIVLTNKAPTDAPAIARGVAAFYLPGLRAPSGP